MKKFFIISGAVFGAILLLMIALPYIFKDEIKAAIDKQLDNTLEAKVYYDADKFNLSFFRNFPHLSVSLGDFGIVGREAFQGDTLMDVQDFNLAVNIKSLIFDDQPRIGGVYLDQPHIFIKVLEDGAANYDIVKASEEEPAAEESPADTSRLKISIDRWEINQGKFVYDDRSMPYYLSLENIEHSGSGDFTLDVFDMVTQTQAENVTMRYDGVEYMSGKNLDADVTLNMNLPAFKFTFKENSLRVNDFEVGVDGFLAMPEDDIEMDLQFATKENNFKTLLSLVPGMYNDSFEGLETDGQLQFNGQVKGVYSDARATMPGFNIDLQVNNAMFQYPDLPTAVNNVNLNLVVDNSDGVIENTMVELKNFHMDLGDNPVDGSFLVENLKDYKMDANLNAEINLADFQNMIPMEGLTMRGMYKFNLEANGVYDSINNRMPEMAVLMRLQDGYIKTEEYPVPIQNMGFNAVINNTTGNMKDTEVRVDDFNMLVDQEQLNGKFQLTNFNDYTWDVQVNGGLDLAKVTEIYPLEGMELAGLIRAEIHSEGKMSDLEAERYERINTTGNVTVNEFDFKSEDLPQGFSISSAEGGFSPRQVSLKNFEGQLGRSDLQLSGQVTNYMEWALKEQGVLEGNLDFRSDKLDLDEWMADEEAAQPADTAGSAPMEVIEVPENIDFVLSSRIKEMIYDGMSLMDMSGNIIVRNGTVRLDGLEFNALGGQFAMNGIYDTRDMTQPKFDFDFEINNLEFSKAYTQFATVRTLAPIAQNMDGSFSTDFQLGGVLQEDMMPDMATLSGSGLVKIAQAAIKNSTVLSGVTNLANLQSPGDQYGLKDVKIQASVKDGRVHVKPFNFSIGKYQSTIAGSNGIDGTLDYNIKTQVPSGAATSAVNNAITSFTGNNSMDVGDLVLNFKVNGTYNEPKVNLGSVESEKGGGKSIKSQVEETIKEEKEKVEQKVQQEVEERKEEVEEKAKEKVEETKKKAEEKVKEETDKKKEDLKDKAKDKLKDLF